MPRENKQSSSELFQTVLLTLAMTGGGLMLFFLVLRFYMLPGVQAEVERESKRYAALVKLLDSDEMNRLRVQAGQADKAGEEVLSLQQLILDSAEAVGFPDPPGSQARFDPQSGAETRDVRMGQPGTLGQIFRFISGVVERKKTVEVMDVKLADARGQSGHYTLSVKFVDYAPPKGG